MKKIITIILAIITIFSVFAITGCGENSTQKPDSRWAAPSSSARPSKVNPTSQVTPSTTQGASLSGGGVPQVSTSGTGTTSDVPTGSGDPVHIPTDGKAPDGASNDVKMLIFAITQIETITKENFRTKLEIVNECEDSYNKLTSAEKAMVVNYGALLKAREACNNFNSSAILVDFEAKVNSLPDAMSLKNAHVATVNQAMEMLNSQRSYLSANLANFASYEAKLNACNQRVIETTVEKTYIAQDLNGNGILESAVQIDKKTYNETTGSGKRGNNFNPPVDTFFGIRDDVHGSAGINSRPYTDTKNPNPITIFQYTDIPTTGISFNATTPGTIKMHVRADKDYGLVFTDGSGTSTTIRTINQNVASSQVTYKVTVPGQVTIVLADPKEMGLLAISFSYPNLPN